MPGPRRLIDLGSYHAFVQLLSSVVRDAGRYRPGVVAATCLCIIWCLVITLSYFSVALANEWVVGSLVWLGGWILALVVSVGVTVTAWLSRRRLLAVLTLTLCLVAATTIWHTDWQSAYVHGFYRENRADFADALAQYESVTSEDLYGVLMADSLRHLSADGRAARIGSLTGPTGPPVLFLPRVLGVPDGGAGYAHLEASQVGKTFDCFGDPCRAGLSLGDGWYWVG